MANLKDAIDHTGLNFVDGSNEFARLWSKPEGEQTFIVDPAPLGADPFLFGIAMVDAIRHAGTAYSRVENVSEEHAFGRIMEGFKVELENPTDNPQPLSGDDGSVN